MLTKIDNPTAYAMRSLINFSNAKNLNPVEIHQLSDVYREHAMSSVVRRCVRLFNEGREHMHVPWSGRPSVTNDLLQTVVRKYQELRKRKTIVSNEQHGIWEIQHN
jgi:hypothetical protein